MQNAGHVNIVNNIMTVPLITYRAEQQRNQALENAEKLKEAYKEYKATISVKLKKVRSFTSQHGSSSSVLLNLSSAAGEINVALTTYFAGGGE